MKAAIRGTEIYFDIAGMQHIPQDGKIIERPVIFLLHGGPGGDHLRYKQHTLVLQNIAQLVFIDHRGCGSSKKTKQEDYTLENNIEDIESLRKYLGFNKICILGASYGGMVAQGYAIRYPQNLDKLILVATAPSHNFITEAKEFIAKNGTQEQKDICEHLWRGDFESLEQFKEYLRLMEPIYSVVARNTMQEVFTKKELSYCIEALNEGFGGFLKEYNFIPHLHKITCPTLIMAGEEDWINSVNQSKIIAENISNSKLRIFKNCAHVVATDANQAYIDEVVAFLATN